MIKFGFRIRTRGGMLLENLMIAARDRIEAERKVNQIYHHCEILDCQEQRHSGREEGALDLEAAIALIGKEAEPGSEGR